MGSIVRTAALLALIAFAVLAGTAQAAPSLPAAFPAAGTLRVSTLVVRAKPDSSARALRVFHQFRPDFRPQIVVALASRRGADGRPWLQIEVPMRPNGRLGWVPAATVDVHPVTLRIVVRRAARRLELFRGHRLLYRTTVAVGRPGMETPRRPLLRPGGLPPRRLVPRLLRLRDECVLEADRLARRRNRGHPWNERAVPPRPGGLTRLRPDVEYRSTRAEALRATRHADRDHPLTLTSCLLDCAPGAVIATNAASERRTTR